MYAAIAYVPNYVTRAYGVKNSYIFGIPDPDLPVQCATSVALRWKYFKLFVKEMHGPVLKKLHESLCMHEITWSVKGALNIVLLSFI